MTRLRIPVKVNADNCPFRPPNHGDCTFHQGTMTMNLFSIILSLTLTLCISVGFVSGQEITEWSETGWVDLFNGKDLSGWQTTGNWIVEEGVITLHPREGEKGWQRYDAYVSSEKTYSDFVLEVDFQFEPKGNSGVFLRVGDLKDHLSSGMEVQILDTHHLEKPGHHDCGGIIRTTAPFVNAVNPAGEWNRYQIICLPTQESE